MHGSRSKDLNPIHVIKNVSMLSVIHGNIREMTNVAAKFTGTLGALGVNILAVAEGSHSFTCVIPGPNPKGCPWGTCII